MQPPIGPDVPFAPRRVPFDYGWVVVAATILGILGSVPGQTMGVSVFTESLIEATQLDRLGFSNAYLLGTLGSALLLPRAGVLIDRVGVRIAVMLAAFLLGAVLHALSRVDGIAKALADVAGLEMSTASFIVLVPMIVGLRFSGQGVMTLASNTMLGRWFRSRRGRATAISTTCVAFGFAYAPRAFDAWIEADGWRGAWQGIAWVEMTALVLIAFFLFRETPESCGLEVDGGKVASGQGATREEPTATRAEALRTRAFWLLTLGLGLHGMIITALTLHIVDLGAESGLERSKAIEIFLPLAIVSTTAGAISGWLSDRVKIRSLLWVLLVSEAVGCVAATSLGSSTGYVLTIAAMGIANGHYGVLTAVGHPRFFGRLHLGAIAGANMTTVVIGSAIGPSVLALSRDALGSYETGLYVMAVPPLLILALALGPAHPNDVPLRS